MRLVKHLNEQDIKPTKEMVKFYDKRTKEHIQRVQNNIKKIVKQRSDLKELTSRAKIHDKSKWSKEEYIPYIWLTWWHKEKNAGRKFEYPEGIKDMTKKAWKSHEKINKHHPGAHSSPQKMSDIDIAEMVADWAAMSQEFGTSLKKWTNDNVGSKWKFTDKQTQLIYDLVGLLK